MPLPNSGNEFQRFLGMITYLGKFIPNLAEVTSPQRTLLKKEVAFKLEKPQLGAIGKLKLLVTTTPYLKIFNPNLQTSLKIDATSEGLGVPLEKKAWNPNPLKMAPCWICVTITSILRKTLSPNQKGNPFYSFCC